MRMQPSDLADVSGAAYTYLMNGRDAGGELDRRCSEPGERVRLRFINGSAMSHLRRADPGPADDGRRGRRPARASRHRRRVPHCDGRDPRRARNAGGAGRVHDLRAVARPYRLRTRHARRERRARGARARARPHRLSDDGRHGPWRCGRRGRRTRRSTASRDAAHGTADRPRHPAACARRERAQSRRRHADDGAAPRLADPGIGLRDNGRARAGLRRSYARCSPIPTAAIPSARSSCTSPATWSASCGRSTASRSRTPSRSRSSYGERVRIRLVNDTMMSHPIHLHGMWSDLEDEAGELSRTQAHDQHAARHATLVPRDGRRAGALGVPLSSVVSHGSRHVPRGARRCVAASRLRVHSVGSPAPRPSLRTMSTRFTRATQHPRRKSPPPSAPPRSPISPACG